jgi:hypothetical protein
MFKSGEHRAQGTEQRAESTGHSDKEQRGSLRCPVSCPKSPTSPFKLYKAHVILVLMVNSLFSVFGGNSLFSGLVVKAFFLTMEYSV